MATLIAVGYPNETTAAAAANQVKELIHADFAVEPDAIAVVSRDKEGRFHVETTHDPIRADAPWAMFWGLLFVFLFVASFGVAVSTELGTQVGHVEKSCTDPEFRDQVRNMLQPGTSALLLVVVHGSPEQAVAPISGYRGTVLTSSLMELLKSVPEQDPTSGDCEVQAAEPDG